jgi:hypothetical protein
VPSSQSPRIFLPILLAAALLGLLLAVIFMGSIAGLGRQSPTPGIATPKPRSAEPTPAEPAILVGAGDIASCSSRADSMTEDLLAGTPGDVFTLGDNGPDGTRRAYHVCYAETWGKELARTHAVVGDEDYAGGDGGPYFTYFGDHATRPGYYSFQAGEWHVIVLNSECTQVGGCDPDSRQGRWLAEDLALHPTACTLALFHRPLVSSAGRANTSDIRPIWEALYAAGVDLVVNGHFHAYQRFAPQTPDLQPDPEFGIRQIIAGTGGNTMMQFITSPANVEAESRTFGVLILRLYPDKYSWEFVPVRGETFRDNGETACHGQPLAQ